MFISGSVFLYLPAWWRWSDSKLLLNQWDKVITLMTKNKINHRHRICFMHKVLLLRDGNCSWHLELFYNRKKTSSSFLYLMSIYLSHNIFNTSKGEFIIIFLKTGNCYNNMFNICCLCIAFNYHQNVKIYHGNTSLIHVIH